MEPISVRVSKRDPAVSPNVEGVRSVVLKDGPRARRVAKLTSIRDGSTGAHHHDSLSIKTWERRKDACSFDGKRSVSMDGEETETLHNFLNAARGGSVPDETGGYLVLSTAPGLADTLRRIQGLSQPDKLDALAMLLRQTIDRPDLIKSLVDRLTEDHGYVEKAAAALNIAVHRRVVEQLERLIGTCDGEADFQRILNEYPWLFGSGYSELLPRRRWTRDQIVDFMPRRTTDGRLEIVEIKTPLGGRKLFGYDASHKSFYAGPELAKVIGQVTGYLGTLERQRDAIAANDGEDVTKICAKVIIGRDNDDAQMDALRDFNAHLSRIEVITFDGLLAIARRVLSYLEEPLNKAKPAGLHNAAEEGTR